MSTCRDCLRSIFLARKASMKSPLKSVPVEPVRLSKTAPASSVKTVRGGFYTADLLEPKLPPINLWTVAPAWIFEERRRKHNG